MDGMKLSKLSHEQINIARLASRLLTPITSQELSKTVNIMSSRIIFSDNDIYALVILNDQICGHYNPDSLQLVPGAPEEFGSFIPDIATIHQCIMMRCENLGELGLANSKSDLIKKILNDTFEYYLGVVDNESISIYLMGNLIGLNRKFTTPDEALKIIRNYIDEISNTEFHSQNIFVLPMTENVQIAQQLRRRLSLPSRQNNSTSSIIST